MIERTMRPQAEAVCTMVPLEIMAAVQCVAELLLWNHYFLNVLLICSENPLKTRLICVSHVA